MHMSWAKDISELELEMKAVKVKLRSSSDQLEQLQRELEMLHEKNKAGIVTSQKQLKESEEVFPL